MEDLKKVIGGGQLRQMEYSCRRMRVIDDQHHQDCQYRRFREDSHRQIASTDGRVIIYSCQWVRGSNGHYRDSLCHRTASGRTAINGRTNGQ